MIQFYDKNEIKVTLAFKKDAFYLQPRHVLVLCRFKSAWLLTNHPLRGLEFPGGKLEAWETVEEAALREVYEETGAVAKIKAYIGEYLVEDQDQGAFVKAILFGDIVEVDHKQHYYETDGPVLISGDLEQLLHEEEFSFIMKDEVVIQSLKRARQLRLFD